MDHNVKTGRESFTSDTPISQRVPFTEARLIHDQVWT